MFEFLKRDLIERNQQLQNRVMELEKDLNQANKSNARCEGIMESIAAPMIIVDEHLKITSANEAALSAMGYRREDVVGKMSCARFQKTLLCGTADCTLKKCMSTGEVVIGETIAETKNGEKIPVQAFCSALYDSEGNACGGIEILSDQTELVSAKWKTDNILKSIAAAMIVVDKDLKITSANEAALTAMGYRGEEVIGKMTCAQFQKTLLCNTADCTLKKCMSTGEVVIGETVAETRDRNKFPIQAFCSALHDKDGNIYGGMEVIMDISEVKRLQKEAIEQKQYLETQVAMLVANLETLSLGDLSVNFVAERKDEIGKIIDSLTKVVSSLRDMATTAVEIAGGDLRGDVTPKSEKDVLGNAFKKMVEGLRHTITEVKTNADQLVTASSQIAASAEQTSKNSESSATAVEEMTSTMHEMSANIQNVAKNTQKQASSVTETSSSIEQMVSSIQRVAENVKRLVSISERSKEAVSSGSEAVNKASFGMNEINTAISQSAQTIMSLGSRTEEMAKIVDVIDDIAEQTNLLALNAAIEAARAGEQGMGFAVVAEEVRKLAERSAKSTREIADLIHSVSKESQNAVDNMTRSTGIVEQGLVSSREVIHALEGIKAAVEEVSKYSSEIGAATQEQAGGSEQIGKAMVNLNEVTQEISTSSEEQSTGAEQVVKAIEKVREMVQQNASSAVELASSAEQLSKQSSGLQTLVAQFALNGNGRH